jgi:AcrR family transcriptional regulator
MARTRAGVLDAAAAVVTDRGTRRASMTDIATVAGVAKGTLYNHFRTKDEVWAALIASEVQRLADECRELPLAAALEHAARRVATHPAVRRIAADEPAVLGGLLAPSAAASGWRAARDAVSETLSRVGVDPIAADLVLRWLASHLGVSDTAAVAATARLLAVALPVVRTDRAGFAPHH